MIEPRTGSGQPPRDELRLAAEDPLAGRVAAAGRRPWQVLIVDDEEDVHTVTRLVLGRFVFEERGVELLSAYSGAAARRMLVEHPDVAVILLDVVMEREDSGLRLVRHIRQEMGNRNVRIILRTGQPGQAPEQEVVAQYDINDYKAKVDLTADKLCTSVTSALRAWRDIRALERSRRGLQRVIGATGALFHWQSRREFAAGVLSEMVGLVDHGSAHEQEAGRDRGGFVARRLDGVMEVVGGDGCWSGREGTRVADLPAGPLRDAAREALARGDLAWAHGVCAGCCRTDEGEELLFVVTGAQELEQIDRDLLRIYLGNAALAYRNVNLSLEIIESQKEMIHTLGEVVETRSQETANHVLRVGEMAWLLARRVGLEPEAAAQIKLAAPMHDVGKVGIPDAVLNKPGRLSGAEYDLMKTHAEIGFEILSKSDRRIMRTAARIAREHHERWDGSGYPRGLRGTDISIEGRVTALVDVFDALTSRRVYRDPCRLDEVVQLIRSERGRHFDPELVDVFLANLTEFVAVTRAHPDGAAGEPQADSGRA